MAKFKDWSELNSSGLDLPINGKVYSIPSPPARVGLRVQAFVNTIIDAARAQEQGQDIDLDEEALSDANELELYQDVLGPTRQQMLDDDVPTEAIKRAAIATMFWIAIDEDAAVAVWEGKAPARAARRSAAASTTPSPTRGSGTSPRTGNRGSRKGRGSRGRSSSRTGS